ncbi:hypothetical protein BH10PSE9_BH10PSE9_16200 [soil metagenome]
MTSEVAKKACDGVAAVAIRLDRFVDALLPGTGRARGAVIVTLIMGFYSVVTAWSIVARKTIDFANYYVGALAFLNHETPYGMSAGRFAELGRLSHIADVATPYFYPPFAAVLVAPLTLLPFDLATWIWNTASAASIVAGTALLLGENRWKREGLLVWGAVAAFVPILTLLHLGQISAILYLCVAFAIHAHEHGRPMSAGAALACGALLKITPIVLIGYLVWRGDWRGVAGAVLGAAVFVALTLPIVGLAGWYDFLTIGLGTFHPVDAVSYPPNFTLNGMFLRLLTENPWVAPIVVAPGLVRPLWIGSALIVVGATVAALWPPLRRSTEVRYEIAFILIAVQLIPHFTFSHQLTLSLLPACVVLLSGWRSGRLDSRWFCGVILVVALVDLYGVGWHWIRLGPVIQSIPLVSVIALWAALGLAFVRRRRSALPV